jgi:hypothetical protein
MRSARNSAGPRHRPACQARSPWRVPTRSPGYFGPLTLSEVVVSELSVPLRTASFEEWWTRTTALAGPLTTIIVQLPHHAVEGLRARAQEAIGPYTTQTGLEFPGVAMLAAAPRKGHVNRESSDIGLTEPGTWRVKEVAGSCQIPPGLRWRRARRRPA